MRFVELVGETRDGKEVVCDIQETRVDGEVAWNAKCYDENHKPVWVTTGNVCSYDSIHTFAIGALGCMAGAWLPTVHVDIDDEM